MDGQRGYKVICGGVSCIFAIEPYRYCGPTQPSGTSDRSQGVPPPDNNHGGVASGRSRGGGTRTTREGTRMQDVAVDMDQPQKTFVPSHENASSNESFHSLSQEPTAPATSTSQQDIVAAVPDDIGNGRVPSQAVKQSGNRVQKEDCEKTPAPLSSLPSPPGGGSTYKQVNKNKNASVSQHEASGFGLERTHDNRVTIV